MATREELQDALINADKAGDTEAARALADALAAMPSDSPAPTTQAPQNAKAAYDAMPTWQKPIAALGDTVRLAGSGAGFGFAEKALAGIKSLGGGDYDQLLSAERKATQDARDRAGSAGTITEAGGQMATSMALPAARVQQAASTPLRLLQAGVIGSTEGIALGGLDAAGHDRDVKTGALIGGATGGLAGPAVEGISTAINNAWRRSSGVNRTPSVDELRTRKDDLYKDVEDSGVMFPPDQYTRMVQDLNTDLIRPHGGVRPVRHANTADTLNQMGDAATTNRPVSLYDLDQTRQGAFEDLILPGGNERGFGQRIVQGIDDMVQDTSGATALRGTPQEGVDALLSARDANGRMRKTQEVSSTVRKAERNVDASSTGATSGNQIRQGFKQILNNDARAIGYTPEEIGLMEGIVKGTGAGNFARSAADKMSGYTGKSIAAGAGAGVGSMFGQTGAVAGGMGGIAMGEMAARGLRGYSERSTRRGAEELQHLTATGRRFETGKGSGPIDPALDAKFRQTLIALGLLAE